MQADFNQEYKKLNVDQKAAVDYIDGPLLVIAGPGTGKTQLLSLRAANILKMTDTLPDNILCLTFTEVGAQEMRDRLIKMIGDEAYKITISTYHSFGSEIIRQYPEFFSGINLRPVNKLKSETIIRELLDDLPYTNELKNVDLVTNLADLISWSKRALLSPENILKVAKSNLDFISATKKLTRSLTSDELRAAKKYLNNFKKLILEDKTVNLPAGVEPIASKWNQELEEAIDECLETKKSSSLSKWKLKFLEKDEDGQYVPKGKKTNETLVKFADFYSSYIKRLAKDGLYDFDDMILMSIEAMKNHNDLKYNLQEKYQYIMLDEYQDTNAAQAELVSLLTDNDIFEGRPNVMAVGDDDQAIFAFQGAKHFNMLDFVSQYKDVKQITLKYNYRSTQDIIDLSAGTAVQIKERLTTLLSGVNKHFKSVRKEIGSISSLMCNNELEQYIWIATEAKNAPAKEIAVIAPEHKYLERASAYLASENVPISYERKENILEDPLISQIITMLRVVQTIADQNNNLTDSYLSSVLNYDFLGLPTEDIWRLSWRAHDTHTPWLELLLKNPKTKDIALMFIKLAASSKIYRYDTVIDQVIGLSDIVINDSKKKVTRSPFLNYYSHLEDDPIPRLLQNLIILREQFIDFNQDNTKALLISDLTQFVDQLTLSAVKLTSNINIGNSEAKVKLMTVHGSKGLEFDTVILPSYINEVWAAKRFSHNQIGLPLNLEYIKEGAEDRDDERLRMLYVAQSRAKNNVITLSYNQDFSGKPTTPLKYSNIEPGPVDFNSKIDLVPLWHSYEHIPDFTPELENLLKDRLSNYSLSPTDFNTFVGISYDGPETFLKSVILGYATPITPKQDYGIAIHASLDWLQKNLSQTGNLPTLKQLLIQYESALTKRRLLPTDFKLLKEQGINALTCYYNQNKGSLSPKDISEYRSEGAVLNGLRIGGKIDKLIIDNNLKQITIVDYKTSKAKTKWNEGDSMYLNSHQLYFYKLLVERSTMFKNYKVAASQLEFIEPETKTNSILPLTYTDKDQEYLIRLIEAVWAHITDLNFPDVSAYPTNLTGIKKFEKDLIEGKI
jgi:DNA helicase-2/ATP-dependent DNA helicase PcrA